MFRFIQQSTTGVRQTFGRFSRTVGPGLTWYIPIVQKITPVCNRLRQDSFRFHVKTRDNVFARLGIAVQYRVKPEDSGTAYFSLQNPKQQIEAYIENVVRARVPQMRLDELFESQDDICRVVSTTIESRLQAHGYTIVSTLVTEIEPPPEVKDAMNRINAAERLKEAAKSEADAAYIKDVRRAEADRDRKRLQGEGISQQRLAILSGYQDGVDHMARKLGLTPRDVIDFVLRTQHLDTMQAIGTSSNAKTLFVPQHPTAGSTVGGTMGPDVLMQALEAVMANATATKSPVNGPSSSSTPAPHSNGLD